MTAFRVGIDSYSLRPLALPPQQVLRWAHEHGTDGVHFTELHLPDPAAVDDEFLDALAGEARDLGLYLEWGGAQHIPFDLTTWTPKEIGAINARAARQARRLGTRVIRSCSGGLMRWTDEAPETEAILEAMARALREQRARLEDLDVVLAIELHFEFTTFELQRLFEMCDAPPGGYLGICLDPMNLLTMIEDPVAATERILPWIVAVHAKDGALGLSPRGLTSFPTPMGDGQIDFERILSLLSSLDRAVHLSVEAHGGSFEIPIFDPAFLRRFPDLTAAELSRLIEMAVRKPDALSPLAREDWPARCERRVIEDVRRLKRLVASGR